MAKSHKSLNWGIADSIIRPQKSCSIGTKSCLCSMKCCEESSVCVDLTIQPNNIFFSGTISRQIRNFNFFPKKCNFNRQSTLLCAKSLRQARSEADSGVMFLYHLCHKLLQVKVIIFYCIFQTLQPIGARKTCRNDETRRRKKPYTCRLSRSEGVT